jgi:hypothetical protein
MNTSQMVSMISSTLSGAAIRGPIKAITAGTAGTWFAFLGVDKAG